MKNATTREIENCHDGLKVLAWPLLGFQNKDPTVSPRPTEQKKQIKRTALELLVQHLVGPSKHRPDLSPTEPIMI